MWKHNSWACSYETQEVSSWSYAELQPELTFFVRIEAGAPRAAAHCVHSCVLSSNFHSHHYHTFQPPAQGCFAPPPDAHLCDDLTGEGPGLGNNRAEPECSSDGQCCIRGLWDNLGKEGFMNNHVNWKRRCCPHLWYEDNIEIKV